MSHYLMKYKGRWRILPVLDEVYHDLPRDTQGNISHEEVELYISCQNGNKITEYGKNSSNRMVLRAYIPSIGRGRNVRKALDAQNIPYTNYMESDEEVEFRFEAKYIGTIAELLKAKTMGADISPFSTKNLPKADVEIPTEEIKRYKSVVAEVQKEDLLIIHRFTTSFLTDILEKKYKKLDKKFDISTDMKKKMMARMAKEYIYSMNMFDEYLKYMQKKITEFYNDN